MNKSANFFSSLIMLFAASQAIALPVQLNEADFNSQISGLATVTEDFESYAIGGQPNPLVFANGTYTSTSPFASPVIVNDTVFCTDGDKCLVNQDIESERIFSDLSAGTTYWGAYLDFVQFSNLFTVTVTGGSGVLTFDFFSGQQGYFLGFHDAMEIISISITNFGNNGGFGNYTFDDITTASAGTSVPEPAVLLLFALGLGFLGVMRIKRA